MNNVDVIGSAQWFDRRLPYQRGPVIAAHHAQPAGGRILPLDQGDDIDSQLAFAKAKFLTQKKPFSFGRIGDCELALLGAGYLHERMPLENLKTLESQLVTAGLNRASLAIRPAFLEALHRTTLLGVQQNWPPVRETTEALLRLSGFDVPPPNAVDFHLLYRLLVDGTLFSWLAGKRVLLVGLLAPDLAKLWTTDDFVRTYSRFGPVASIKIAGTCTTRGRGDQGSWMDLEEATKVAQRTSFDVALLGCGAMAKILAVRIQDTGRTALDAGFIFDALMGHSQRVERTVIRDGAWPEK